MRNEDHYGRCARVGGGCPRRASHRCRGRTTFFENSPRTGRFSGIFLDFFQKFFCGRHERLAVSRGTRCTHRRDGHHGGRARWCCSDLRRRTTVSSVGRDMSGNPSPVWVCEFSTAARMGHLVARCSSFEHAHDARLGPSRGVAVDVAGGDRETVTSGLDRAFDDVG